MNLIYATVFTVAFIGVSFNLSNNLSSNNTSASVEYIEDQHTCNGTATLGGSCSGTCNDNQSCTCSTGLVSCSCSCSGGAITTFQTPDVSLGYPVNSTQRQNWTELGNILRSESSAAAQDAYAKYTNTYQSLNNGDLNGFATSSDVLRASLRNQSTNLRGQINNWLASKGADERF
jgi:hypothetical protein